MSKSSQRSIPLADYSSCPIPAEPTQFLTERLLRGDKSLRILDYGCGNAMFVVTMAKAGFDIVGVDINPEYVRLAKFYCERMAVKPERIVLVSEKRLPFPAKSFDCIYANTVLEHVCDVPSYLSECQRLLKPDGTFFATIPTRFSLMEGHIPLPLAHWLPAGRLRRWYIRTFAGPATHPEIGPGDLGEFFDLYISRLNYWTPSVWMSVFRQYFGEVRDISLEKKRDFVEKRAERMATPLKCLFLTVFRMPLIAPALLWLVKQTTTINLLAVKPLPPTEARWEASPA